MSARLTHIRMVDKHTYHISCYNTHMPLLPTLNLDQITVWLTDEVITPWVWETLRELLPGQMTFCSRQQLLQNHLNIREQVNFQASLYGNVPQVEGERLLERSGLNRADHKTCYYQPRLENRLLSYVLALLPDPDAILIDDLTRGLSPPAQKQVWQFVLTEQALRPRTIIYLTSDIETAKAVGDEIGYFENGTFQKTQAKAEAETTLTPVSTIILEFKDRPAVLRFQEGLQGEPLPEVQSSRVWPDGCTMELKVTNAAATLFELTWRSGRDLINFAVLPQLAENTPPSTQTPSPPTQRSHIRSTYPTPWPSRSALWQFILSEWRCHFRSFWKSGNLLFSAIYSLLILAGVSGNIEGNEAGFWRFAPLALVFTSAMTVGLATESIGRLAVTAGMDTLFEKAQSPSREAPFSLLAFFDTTPLSRTGLLFGLGVGQLLLWAIHMVVFAAFWIFLLTTLADSLHLMFVSLGFWLLMALDGLAVAIVLGGVSTQPRQGLITGWISWFLIVLSLGSLPPLDIPILWLWPFSGLANAFYYFSEPSDFWTPFLLAMIGSCGLWGLAIWLFQRKKSVLMVQR